MMASTTFFRAPGWVGLRGAAEINNDLRQPVRFEKKKNTRVTVRENPGAGHPVLGSAADRFEAQDQQDEWVWSQEYPMVLAELAASTIGSRSPPVVAAANGSSGPAHDGQDEPDDEQDDADRDQDVQGCHEQPDDEQDDAQGDHVFLLAIGAFSRAS